jgi:hypothetical protein
VAAKEVFEGGVRTLGVYYLAKATLNLLMIVLKAGSLPTGSHVSIFDDWVTFTWRFGIGMLLTFAGGAVVRLVDARRATSG